MHLIKETAGKPRLYTHETNAILEVRWVSFWPLLAILAASWQLLATLTGVLATFGHFRQVLVD